MSLRGAIAAYFAQALADARRPATFRLLCAQQLARMALMDWDSDSRTRRAAARDAGAALLRVLETMPLETKGRPPMDGEQPSTAGECETLAGAADWDQLAGKRWQSYGGD